MVPFTYIDGQPVMNFGVDETVYRYRVLETTYY